MIEKKSYSNIVEYFNHLDLLFEIFNLYISPNRFSDSKTSPKLTSKYLNFTISSQSMHLNTLEFFNL